MKPRAYVIWQIMDYREFDEAMSRKLWQEAINQDDLLEFGFYLFH